MKSKLLFGNCAELRSEKVDPKSSKNSFYIGLEHIEQQTLCLAGHGFGTDVDSQKQRFYEGDILFGKLRPYFRKVVVAPFDGICSTDIWVVKPKTGIDRNFLFYWMASEEFIKSSTHASEGGRMPRAKWDWVSNFELRNFSFEEQTAIGTTLNVLDQKIAANRALSKTLEDIAQTIFKSWFIDFDPVKSKMKGEMPVGLDDATAALFPDEMEESELGLIPKGWGVRSLDEISEYLNGLAMQKFPVTDEDEQLPVIKIAQLRAGNTQGADVASGLLDSRFIIKDGDILFSWSGTLEVETWAGGPGALNQHLFKVSGKTVPDWYSYLSTKSFLSFFREIASGKATTMGHIQRGHLSESKLAIPNLDSVNRANEIIEPLISLKIKTSIESRNLAEIRDSLLPRLISGELQIPEEMLAS
jgi:type I restriction enzyme S subunit